MLVSKCLPKAGVSKAGRPYRLTSIQGQLVYEDGDIEVFVLDLFDSERKRWPEFPRGRYTPVFEPVPDNATRKLECRLVDLLPYVSDAQSERLAA